MTTTTDISQGRRQTPPAADATPPEMLSPKQQMLDCVDVLRARIEADFVTGFQLFAGTQLGEPVQDLTCGSFAHSPLDTALLITHSLYRRLYALKEADLDRQAGLLRQHS